MRLFRFMLLSVFIFQATAARSQAVVKIPFQLTSFNNLSVSAIINESDTVHLLFHLAANSLSVTEEATKKLNSIHFDTVTDSVKSWGGQSNSSRVSFHNSIRIGEISWHDQTIWENSNTGQFTDGKFGMDLFKDRAIAIDFDKSLIILYRTLPKKLKKWGRSTLVIQNDLLFIEARCLIGDSVIRNNFLLHSGYSGAILFDDQFAFTARLADHLTITGENTLTDSYGNKLISRQVTLPSLYIQDIELKAVPAGFFEGSLGRQKVSIIGGDILKRFNVAIDEKRKYIYFAVNQFTRAAYRKM